MAWTAPITFTANSILTVGQLNTYLRDNISQTFPALATDDNRFMVSTGANTVAARRCLQNNIATSETTASTTYVNLTTVGPTVTIDTGTAALVMWSCSTSNNTANTSSRMSVAVSGATTIVATDNYAVHVKDPGAGNAQHWAISVVFNTLTAGSNVFTAKYSVQAGTGTFQFRKVAVLAF